MLHEFFIRLATHVEELILLGISFIGVSVEWIFDFVLFLYRLVYQAGFFYLGSGCFSFEVS